MRLKLITTAATLALSASMAAAMVTVNHGPYSVTYDETTPVFSGIDGSFSAGGNVVGFHWDVSTALSAFLLGSGASQTVFQLPSFTVTANPSHSLSGPVSGFLGNITFSEVAGGSVSVSAQADLAIDGVPAGSIGGGLTRTVTAGVPGVFTLGYYSGAAATPPLAFSTFSVSNASVTVDLSGAGLSSFASLQGQPQNQLQVSFVAVPVPEPATHALLLAGLAVCGVIALRRKP